jgi:hypothetical protein
MMLAFTTPIGAKIQGKMIMPISPHTKMYAIAIILAVLSWDAKANVSAAPVAVAAVTTIAIQP